jgi:hypothetical protein
VSADVWQNAMPVMAKDAAAKTQNFFILLTSERSYSWGGNAL